jgi:hypothetical protein
MATGAVVHGTTGNFPPVVVDLDEGREERSVRAVDKFTSGWRRIWQGCTKLGLSAVLKVTL